MTLKELLDSLSFDEIAPNAFIGGNLATWQLYSNKYTIYILICVLLVTLILMGINNVIEKNKKNFEKRNKMI